MKNQVSYRAKGISAAAASAVFLGLAPIFGKQAFLSGFSPLAVVALRTALAAILLVLLLGVFSRKYFYIYPAGLLGCLLAGAVNGIGSVLFYLALDRLSASVSQLLYALYPIFVAVWALLDRQPLSRVTLLRTGVAFAGVVFLTAGNRGSIDWTGVFLMLVASILYALHIPINQRVLIDIPAPTVTLYTLLSMSIVVVPIFLIINPSIPIIDHAWLPLLGLTLVTFLSRLTLFTGVKHLGGMQAALLGLSELIVTVSIGVIWLGDRLQPLQWLGAGLLGFSILMVGFEKITIARSPSRGGLLSWIRPTRLPPNFPDGLP